jgi:hypothetical protein
MFSKRRARRLLVNGLLAGGLLSAAFAAPASATHFRGGDINYAQIGGTNSTNADFQTTQSYRCTYFFASCPAVGTTVALPSVGHGDGSFSAGNYVVVASNDAEDNFTARENESHNYADLARRTAAFASCCTISTLLNNPDASYRVFADVNLAQDPQSPRTSVPPVVNVGAPGVQTFSVAASDPGGQTLRWRLATDAETQGFQSNPPDFAVNPSTGQASFDTTGKTLGLYHASVVIEAMSGTDVRSSTQTTFLIRVGAGAGNQAPVYVAPTPADGGDYTVAPGANLSIDLRATDPDAGDTVDIVPGPLPAGATFNDTPANPVNGTFSFTPTLAQNNQDFILNFTAQDGKGGSDLRSYTVRVRGAATPNVPPTVTITTPDDGATYATGQNVAADYACADSDGTVVTCAGPVADGSPINTATAGTKTFTVTATDDDGDTATKTVTYHVRTPNVPPTVTITRPVDGATYLPGQNVAAQYTCADSDGTVASCVGPVANGQPINTATSGNKTFSVTATDNDGATKTESVSYRVGVVAGLCRGTALSLLGLDPATANPAETPCATKTKTLASVNTKLASGGGLLGSLLGNTLTASLLDAGTTAGATSARAEAHVADVTVRLGVTAVRIQGVHSQASSTLTSCGSATVSGTSSVASLSVAGVAIPLSGTLTVPLLGGAIHLNQSVRSGNTITQRAVFIDLPGTALDIVLGESKAGVVCS